MNDPAPSRRYEELRVVWLFGKPYWWDRQPDGRLALTRAAWMTP